VASVLDVQSTGCTLDNWPQHCLAATLGMSFIHVPSASKVMTVCD